MTMFISPFFRAVSFSLAIGWFLALPSQSAESNKRSTMSDSTASILVRTALERELAGHNDQRNTLLQVVAQESPNHSIAHWQLGEVLSEDKQTWLSPSEVERAAKEDRRLAEYRKLRDEAGPTLAERIALAQWCRQNHLVNEELSHWIQVLRIQPNYPEAIQRLQMLQASNSTRNEQTARLEDQPKVGNPSANWRSLAAKWRQSLARGETIPPEIREKVVNFSDAGEIASLQKAMWLEVGSNKTKMQPLLLALAQTLKDNPHPAAAEYLSRLAVFAERDDIRDAAVAGLRDRSFDHYVPLLLASLQTPIEADLRFDVDGHGNLITKANVYREGALTDASYSSNLSPRTALREPPLPIVSAASRMETAGDADSYRNSTFASNWIDSHPQEMAAWKKSETEAYNQAKSYNDRLPAINHIREVRDGMKEKAQSIATFANSQVVAGKTADAFYGEVESANRAIEENNARITRILAQTTGKDFGEDAMQWWKWWLQEYNETNTVTSFGDDYSPDDGTEPSVPDEIPSYKPTTTYATNQFYAAFSPTSSRAVHSQGFASNSPVPPKSCFAPGTKVWTQFGRTPIEKVQVGDRVLSQDVTTGEMAYKPVLATTVRKPGPRIKIGLGSEMITATPSHPFWVNGKGWELSKQVEVGWSLHAVSGGVPVESIEKLEVDPSHDGYSYNLIVADFDTYFVGEQGILVHDNTARQPTSARLPGLPAETPVAVADER
jgi:hypothetical protein